MEKLEHGKFYHIYNRGINRQDIFLNKAFIQCLCQVVQY